MLKLMKIVWFGMAFWVVICLTVIAVSVSNALSGSSMGEASPIGLVTISGELYDAKPTLEQLKSLVEESGVKGIVLRVESPGGTVAAAQEIYQALERLRKDSIPVVASYGNIAASGGYYASLPAECIFANPGSLTGSIGVISQFMHGEKLMEKLGIDALTLKSGALKDAGNPFRAPNEADITYFQGVIDDSYEQFLEAVSIWREIPADSLRPIADGRVFTGRMAYKSGLVDSLGGMQDAVQWMSDRLGLDAVPSSLETAIPPKPFFEELMEGVESAVPQSLRNRARVLWMVP